MKKILSFTLMLLSSIALTEAQIARWLIHPIYDNMYIPEGTDLIVADSEEGTSTTFLSMDGKFINRVKDHVHPFRNGMAVTTMPGSEFFHGYILSSGMEVRLKQGRYLVAHFYPYVNDGYLLVQEPFTKAYRYVDKNGMPTVYRYDKAYPFFNGYASCKVFENQERMKKPIPCLLSTDLKPVSFTFQGKTFGEKDLDFVSSVNDDNIAIVVAKKKVYLFRSRVNELVPLCATENIENPKEQVKVSGDWLYYLNDTTWIMRAKLGKEDMIRIDFDKFMRPKSIVYSNSKKQNFFIRAYRPHAPKTPMEVLSMDGKEGLLWDKEEVLAPQFDEVLSSIDDKAIVRKNGKCGLVQVIKDTSFEASIYVRSIFDKEEKIFFAHKMCMSTLRVDIPSSIPAEKVFIMMDTSAGWIIDRTSKKCVNTPSGNYVQYDCGLRIPEILFEQDTGSVTYPIRVVYEGFVSPLIKIEKKVQLYSNWRLTENLGNRIMDNGSCIFEFNLNVEQPDRAQYDKRVEVRPSKDHPDSNHPNLLCENVNLIGNSGRCTVTGLYEGVNEITIDVKEDGVPTISFPILITYTKKAAPTVEEPEKVEEEVAVEVKASKSAKTRQSRPKQTKEPTLPILNRTVY